MNSKYDPKSAFYARRNPTQRAGDARRSSSSHENIGGHDSNYQSEKTEGNKTAKKEEGK